jgi:CRISPR-associated protein Cmr1
MTSLSSNSREWVLKAQSPIWTGDADRNGAHTIPTGLLGSLRWWFEVLVRGMGGSACDPAYSDGRCPDKNEKHCVVCELFGCTGWARKFRFDVLDVNGKIKRDQIKKDESFQFRFTPLRPMRDEEWALLDLTLRLIVDYGAIGGKTVLKPSNEKNRSDQPHHEDYGLVAVERRPDGPSITKEALQRYVVSGWRSLNHGDFGWASLENFWCVTCCLARQHETQSAFNRLLGRREDKSIKERKGKHVIRWSDSLANGKDNVSRWLAGSKRESKKVFSFKDPARTFGFVKPGLLTLDAMRERLKSAWSRLADNEFLTGPTILDRLLVQVKEGAR